MPSFTITRVDLTTKKSGKELAQYARHEFRDSNSLWMYSQADGSVSSNPVNTMKPVPRLLAPVNRIARAVASLLF
jgi:hypothetical protein